MKTFEAFFTYRIKGSHTADARVLVQAEDVDAAQQKITTAFQRVVDGETPKEAPPIERGHARLVWVAPVETPLDEVRKTSGKPEVHAPPVAHQPAPKPEIKPGTFENALNFVRTTPPAISGKGGHAHTFSVARRLVESSSLSDSEVWTLLLEFNRRCEPPWSETELRRKLDEAKAASGRVVAPVEPSTDFYCAHCLLERNNNRNEPCPHCGRNNAGIGEGPPQETSVPLTVEEVAAVREWLLSPRSGSYKRPYTKNPKLAPKTEPLTKSELEALRVDATSLGSDGVLHFTKRDPLVLRLLDEHANMKMMLAGSAEESSGSTEETPVVYRLHTECLVDTVRLLMEVHVDRIAIESHVVGAEVTLENPRFGDEVLSLEKLRDRIRDRIPDSHVMTETLTQERT